MTSPNGDSQTDGLLGTAERLLAAGAALGGGLYVLVNSAYIEYFDDFGVTPEQVGFDRGAVLARSAWLALLGVALLGPLFIVITRLRLRSVVRAFQEETGSDGGEPAERREHHRQREVRSAVRAGSLRMIVAAGVTILVLGGFFLLQNAAEAEADRVARGEASNGIGWIVPILDVRAARAEVVWLSADKERPPALSAKHLMYLGGNGDFTVLLACGDTTLVLRTEDVVVTFPGQGSAPQRDESAERGDLIRARAAAGGCRTP